MSLRTCQSCGRTEKDDTIYTCPQCGEASWSGLLPHHPRSPAPAVAPKGTKSATAKVDQ